jgi:5-methylcytosine-specific restriction endonuclease McrA
MRRRAKYRYGDIRKLRKTRLAVGKRQFVDWYVKQGDRCAYCGLTFDQIKQLRIRRAGGYFVAWDIDRIDSSLPYKLRNLALACFVCNMAKGDVLTANEARIIGRAVRKVWHARLNRPT